MSTELLDHTTLETLSKSSDEPAFLERLNKTAYGNFLSKISSDASAITYEKVFYSLLMWKLERITSISSKEFVTFLNTYFPLKYEIINLKRILRGKYVGQSNDEIRDSLLPVKPQAIKNFSDFIEAKGVDEVVSMLKGTIYESLNKQLSAFHENDALWVLEVELNHIYLHEVEGAIGKSIKKYKDVIIYLIEFEIAVQNLLLSLSLPAEKRILWLEYLTPLLEHGHLLVPESIQSVAKGSKIDSLVLNLKDPMKTILTPLLTKDASMVRTLLDRHILNVAEKKAKENAYDFPYILWYLIRSEAETMDLTRIAWGLDQGMTVDQFSKYFVLL